jgi:nucleotide-binding universal stress UspA family protein
VTPAADPGPVLFAYDGSELAKRAIEVTGQLFGAAPRQAIVLTVWQLFDVGFLPGSELALDAAQVTQVERAAQEAAEAGASLAAAAGFRARSQTIEGAPTWKAIVDCSEAVDADLIALGSHGRSGVRGVLIGSVAGAVAAHSRRSVLIVHARSQG